MRFRFPSTGKAYRKEIAIHAINAMDEFPFPSTGKAYRKQPSYPGSRARECVSIPFHRESVSQVSKSVWFDNIFVSFHSLPPGKRIASQTAKIADDNVTDLFQFPSNGKAYRKSVQCGWFAISGSSFHSLRPGKPIQSEIFSPLQINYLPFRFPSSGKAYPKEH